MEVEPTKSVADWAKELGITRAALYLRMKRHPMDPEKIFAPKGLPGRPPSIQYQDPDTGKTGTCRDWAKQLNITPAQFSREYAKRGFVRVQD